MKISSAKLSDLNVSQLINLGSSDPLKRGAVLQKAYEKDLYYVFECLSKLPDLKPSHIELILKYTLSKTNDRVVQWNIFENIINRPQNILKSGFKHLQSATADPSLSALLFISGGTPNEIIDMIINRYSLTSPEKTFIARDPIQNPEIMRNSTVLKNIQTLISKGYQWNNVYSGRAILTRIIRSPYDSFIETLASGNLHPEIFSTMMNALNQYSDNADAISNLNDNMNAGANLARMFKEKFNDNIKNPQLFTTNLIDILEESNDEEILRWIWYNIQTQLTQQLLVNIYTQTINEKNPILILFNNASSLRHEIISRFVDLVRQTNYNSTSLMESKTIKYLIHTALQDTQCRDIILTLPEHFFNRIRMSNEDRVIIEKYFNPSEEQTKQRDYGIDISKLLASNNWHDRYKIAMEIQQEAGVKENTAILMLGLTMFFTGATINEIAKSLNISKQEIQLAIQDPRMVEKAKSLVLEKKLNTREQEDRVKNLTLEKKPNTREQEDVESRQDWEINILARTLFKEAKSEPIQGKMAIASVIYNRSNGIIDEMIGVIQRGKQFSCWNNVSGKEWNRIVQYNGSEWDECLKIARLLISKDFHPTIKADHYWNPKIVNPRWAYDKRGNKVPYQQIGNHRFIQLNQWVGKNSLPKKPQPIQVAQL